MAEVFSIRELVKAFEGREVLHVERLDLPEGVTLAIIGPNGAGKTTLLRILSGLWLPTGAERLQVLGHDMSGRADQRARRALSRQIGLATSSSQLFGLLTVRENLEYACRLFEVPKERRRAAVERALDLCGISDRADDRVWTLSTGLRQRANIARAVVTGPRLLFLDEPTSGLDPIAAAGIQETFRVLANEGIALVLCTHIMQEVDDLADQVAFLSHGRIIAEGTPDELRAAAGERVWRSRVGADALEALAASVGARPGARMMHGSPQGGEVDVTVFGDVDASLFEGHGLPFECRAVRLQDAFLYLGGEHALD